MAPGDVLTVGKLLPVGRRVEDLMSEIVIISTLFETFQKKVLFNKKVDL